MHHKQIKYMMTKPKAMMDFHAYGKTPVLKDSLSTPLRELILSIPNNDREKYRGIVVDKRLGFTGRLTFHSIFHLLRWLGYQQKVVGNQTLPYYGYVNRSFRKKLTIEMLKDCCSKS